MKYTREIIIAGLLILLLSVYNCSNNRQHELAGEAVQLKQQLRKQVDGLKTQKIRNEFLFDSISAENKKRDLENLQLQKTNLALMQRINYNAKQTAKKKQEVKKYSFKQSAEFLAKRYETKSIEATPTSVNLKENIPNNVVEELIDKDAMVQDLGDLHKIIENKDSEIGNKDKTILSKDLEIAAKEIETKKTQEALDTSQEITKKIEKELKQLKTKTFILKYIVPPAAFIGGVLIGKQIVK